ncbi:MAG: hypothetical protein ACTSQJ_05550 [Promethearchaeota archaeon]
MQELVKSDQSLQPSQLFYPGFREIKKGLAIVISKARVLSL